eukprot:6199266-Pleurochrysis_carterae.AAC.9
MDKAAIFDHLPTLRPLLVVFDFHRARVQSLVETGQRCFSLKLKLATAIKTGHDAMLFRCQQFLSMTRKNCASCWDGAGSQARIQSFSAQKLFHASDAAACAHRAASKPS